MISMKTSMGFNPYNEVPEWARFLTLEEFRAFLDTIANELRSRDLLFQDNNGLLEVAFADGQIARCGLANIALKCGAVGRDGYAREVALHFDRVLGKPLERMPFPESFKEVKPLIRARVYRNEDIRDIRAKLITKPLATGLTTVAVYDLPNVIAAVSPEHLETWKISPAEVLRVGIANVGREKVERDTFRLGTAEVFSLADESGFAVSQVLHIESYLPPSKLGALIAMPSRHVLIGYSIQLATVVEALHELIPFVDRIYNNPPGGDEDSQLTTNLYWWRKGSLECLPAGMDMPGFPGPMLAPPQEFIDAVLSKAAQARG
jgi:hypothetical protein